MLWWLSIITRLSGSVPEPNGIPDMPCICQSFTSLSGGVSRNSTSVTTCDHEAIAISGAPDVTCRDHIKGFLGYRPPESMDRRDLKGLPVLLPSLVLDQLNFCHSRPWFSLVPKDLLWWGPTQFSTNAFHGFISWNEKIFYLKPDINTSAAVQVQCLLPCILLFERFILWKEATSQYLLYLFCLSTLKSLCLSPFFDYSHCSGFSQFCPPFP